MFILTSKVDLLLGFERKMACNEIYVVTNPSPSSHKIGARVRDTSVSLRCGH